LPEPLSLEPLSPEPLLPGPSSPKEEEIAIMVMSPTATLGGGNSSEAAEDLDCLRLLLPEFTTVDGNSFKDSKRHHSPPSRALDLGFFDEPVYLIQDK